MKPARGPGSRSPHCSGSLKKSHPARGQVGGGAGKGGGPDARSPEKEGEASVTGHWANGWGQDRGGDEAPETGSSRTGRLPGGGVLWLKLEGQ